MDFNNQNQQQTQINTGWWRDLYLVDQFGDRHPRGSAYFVNGAGEPRDTIDIPYGQSARYIMVFNEVSTNAATVSLHSAYGNIHIENIGLDAGAAAAAAQPAGQATEAQAPAQATSAAGNAASGIKDNATAVGKQRAGEARDKAVNKANDSINKLMNKIPH